jgi:hypothetical protein
MQKVLVPKDNLFSRSGLENAVERSLARSDAEMRMTQQGTFSDTDTMHERALKMFFRQYRSK